MRLELPPNLALPARVELAYAAELWSQRPHEAESRAGPEIPGVDRSESLHLMR